MTFNNLIFTLPESTWTDTILSEITRPGSVQLFCLPTQHYVMLMKVLVFDLG